MDVRLGHLGVAARADRAHGGALGDGVALPHPDRPEVEQRDRVPVGRLDRDRLAVRRERAGVGDRTGRRREDEAARVSPDVDPAMLARCVRIGSEDERAEDEAVRGPGPAVRRRRGKERGQDGRDEESSHRFPPLLSALRTSDSR